MRVLVCGGRAFDDRANLFAHLDTLWTTLDEREPFSVIQGGAPGADFLARVWCSDRGADCKSYPADWKAHGLAAGPIRNQDMIDLGKPDLVLAFAGNRGTADMVRRARAAGIEVREIAPTPSTPNVMAGGTP